MALRTEFALLSFLALTTTPGCCAITVDGTLALRGGASLPQSVLALSGSALSLSGLATLIECAVPRVSCSVPTLPHAPRAMSKCYRRSSGK